MSFRIIADSCCDRTAQLNVTNNITYVPLTLSIGDYTIADDENFDQEDFIARTLASDTIAKSACPAPSAFAQAMECEEDDVYVITITDKLSGTYNSALQGKALFEEENGDKKNIHVFNSLATSGIESLVAEKIIELAGGGADFKTVVDTVEDFIVNHTALYYLHMLQADAKAVGIDIPVISAYRSYETQRALFDSYYAKDGDKADTYSARPGHSEHQTGLAFDVGAIDDNYGDTIGGKWLYNNCANYGFIIRYLKGKEDITGYKYEPWHIRYVGSVAEYIMNQGITLEEYLNIA